jgi:hypothetical protein
MPAIKQYMSADDQIAMGNQRQQTTTLGQEFEPFRRATLADFREFWGPGLRPPTQGVRLVLKHADTLGS